MKMARPRPPPLTPSFTFLWKPEANLWADVYLPHLPGQDSNEVTCIAIYVHGGAWIMGNKLDYCPSLIRALLALGIAVIIPDYRKLIPNHFAEVLEDVVDMENVLRHCEHKRIDPKAKVILVGASAGGHLAEIAVCVLGNRLS
jgi:acetyl esterase/lipase